MRLVIDGRRLAGERTGVGRYLEDLLEEWRVAGPPLSETLVVLSDRSGLARVPNCPSIKARVVGEGWPGVVWERFGLGRVLRRGDLLFAPTNLVPATWTGPTVLVMFDTLQAVRPTDFSWHVRLRFGHRYRDASARASRIVVPSESTARDVERFYRVPAQRIRVIHPAPGPAFQPMAASGRDVQEAPRELGLDHGPFVLFLGKRSRRRNLESVVQAFRLLRGPYPDLRLVIAGPKSAANRAEASDAIIEAGHVSEPTLRGLLASAVALVYPSEYEGFGLPIVEAMASGCPVITLRNSALEEAGGAAAIYLGDASPLSIASAIERLLTDREELERRRELGLAHVTAWTRSQFAESVTREIRSLAGIAQFDGRSVTRWADRTASPPAAAN
jgi:glycosyltransferase involved in cell wall biosynthesis